jgi:hypothetical protein
MPTITWNALLRFKRLLLLLLAAGCAATTGKPAPDIAAEDAILVQLPASFANVPSCPGCLSVTLTLRSDGAYVVRERLGSSEFYDFGRWRFSGRDRVLRLDGGRDLPRRYVLQPPDALDAQEGTQGGDLRRLAAVETLRGPFRMVGQYDGKVFRECRSRIAWPLADSRAGRELHEEFVKQNKPSAIASIDGRFDERPGAETLVVLRLPSLLNQDRCPG